MSSSRKAICTEPGIGRRRLLSLVLVAVAILPATAAPAGPLDAPKADGLIGERIDGYLGIVDPAAPASVKALVEQVNAQRRQAYADIAQKRGVPVEAVAQIAGEKVVAEAPSGQYVMGADGRWRRKP
jgi:hypothetical protein